MNERDQLAFDVQAALAGLNNPVAPTLPPVPGVRMDASQAETDAAGLALMSKPADLMTGAETAFVAAMRDREIHAILTNRGDANQADKDRLRAEILKVLRGGE